MEALVVHLHAPRHYVWIEMWPERYGFMRRALLHDGLARHKCITATGNHDQRHVGGNFIEVTILF
jgi:3',5'-cyclic AMP phosphodiesterase CpdA